jgi:hypothetical protein
MASRLLTVLGMALSYVQPVAYRAVAIMTDEDSSTFATWPTITSGSGVPSEAQPNGSVYFRTNGVIYRRVGGAWVAGSSTGSAVTGVTVAAHNVSAPENLGVPAAKGTTDVHAVFPGNNASNNFPGPFSAPGRSRNLRVTFGAGYDGGNVTVNGQDQFGTAISETFVANPGATVVGVKVFATVLSATKSAVGANGAGASIGTGDKLGLGNALTNAVGALSVNGLTEAATFDATYSAVTPTTLPDGARTYVAAYPRSVTHPVTDAGHSH